MCFLFFIQGSSQGLTDLGGTNVLLTMWKDFASSPLSCTHLGYGIGAFLLNLFIRPFILQDKPDSMKNFNETQFDSNGKSSRSIVIPYSFVSILCFIISIGHLTFYIQKRRTHRERVLVQQVNYSVDQTNENSPEDRIEIETKRLTNEKTTRKSDEVVSSYSPLICGRGSFHYGLISSIIYICYIFFIGGNDQTFSKFYFTYLKFEKFQISTGAASWAISLYWLSYSVRIFFSMYFN